MKNSNFENTVELSRFIRSLFDDSYLSFRFAEDGQRFGLRR